MRPSFPQSRSGSGRIGTGARAVAAGLLVIGLLAGVAVLLERAQSDSHRLVRDGFSDRARVSAALTESVFSSLGASWGSGLDDAFGGGTDEVRRNLRARMAETDVPYLAVVDARGRTIAVAGTLERPVALRRAAVGGPTLSDVLGVGDARTIEYAIPFGQGAERRALVQGTPLRTMSAFLGDYLARLGRSEDKGIALTDSRGTVITSFGRVVTTGSSARDRHGARVPVPETTWTLHTETERANVFGSVDRMRSLPWILLGALTVALLIGLRLYGRTLTSVREQRRANDALRESRDQARNLVAALEEAVFIYHADGRMELLNDSARAIGGPGFDPAGGLGPGVRVVDERGEPIADEHLPARRALQGSRALNQIIGIERPDGTRRWFTLRARPLIRQGEHEAYAVVGSCTDITEQRETELHLTELSERDPLTGLHNRRRFEADLAQQLARCRRHGEAAALVALDLDGFKQVNDTRGHLAGDEVLRAVADAMRTRLRGSDCSARIGGDEFALLLLGVDEDDARRTVDDVVALASVLLERRLDPAVALSVSCGIEMLDRRSAGVIEALEAADRAMYADKHTGRIEGPALPSVSGDRPVSRAPGRGGAIQVLLTAVQARDSYTASHSREVVALARGVARRLGVTDEALADIESAALLHDLGKLGIPDAILRKRGPLTAPERAVMREHPAVGAQMVATIPELVHLAPSIRAEHERWDGRGYPDGLAGETIPLASRIAFVCDAYHAMTSDRPYRRALGHAEAVAEIQRESGRQFCPAAAAALVAVLAETRAPAAAAA